MNSIFIYDFVKKAKEGRNVRVAIMFCSETAPTFQVSDYEIRDFLAEAMPPDVIYLIVSKPHDLSQLESILNSQRLREVLGQLADVLHLVAFDHRGRLYEYKPLQDRGSSETGAARPDMELLDDSLTERIYKQGLRAIFRKRHGILEASETHHYAKPSGKHCNQFIRAGNVLNTSSEINFIALCLLPFIEDMATHIYCDTSSINSVAYAVSHLRSRFQNIKERLNKHVFRGSQLV